MYAKPNTPRFPRRCAFIYPNGTYCGKPSYNGLSFRCEEHLKIKETEECDNVGLMHSAYENSCAPFRWETKVEDVCSYKNMETTIEKINQTKKNIDKLTTEKQSETTLFKLRELENELNDSIQKTEKNVTRLNRCILEREKAQTCYVDINKDSKHLQLLKEHDDYTQSYRNMQKDVIKRRGNVENIKNHNDEINRLKNFKKSCDSLHEKENTTYNPLSIFPDLEEKIKILDKKLRDMYYENYEKSLLEQPSIEKQEIEKDESESSESEHETYQQEKIKEDKRKKKREQKKLKEKEKKEKERVEKEKKKIEKREKEMVKEEEKRLQIEEEEEEKEVQRQSKDFSECIETNLFKKEIINKNRDKKNIGEIIKLTKELKPLIESEFIKRYYETSDDLDFLMYARKMIKIDYNSKDISQQEKTVLLSMYKMNMKIATSNISIFKILEQNSVELFELYMSIEHKTTFSMYVKNYLISTLILYGIFCLKFNS